MPARPWQPEEDAALTSAVEKIGARNWKWVANEVKTRDHVQCAQRWLKALKPGLHKGQWKPKEYPNPPAWSPTVLTTAFWRDLWKK